MNRERSRNYFFIWIYSSKLSLTVFDVTFLWKISNELNNLLILSIISKQLQFSESQPSKKVIFIRIIITSIWANPLLMGNSKELKFVILSLIPFDHTIKVWMSTTRNLKFIKLKIPLSSSRVLIRFKLEQNIFEAFKRVRPP